MWTERNLSASEAMMWRLESDPQLTSTVANVTFLDRPADLDTLRRRMDRAAQLVPRLRRRVVTPPSPLQSPRWADDPEFHINHHVVALRLPGGSTEADVLAIAAEASVEPFDLLHPLWKFIVIDGLRGGRGAVVQKIHHSVADGEGLILLSLHFLDLTRDAPEPPPVDAIADDEPADHDMRDLLFDPIRVAGTISRRLVEIAAQPERLTTLATESIDTVRAIASQISQSTTPLSPLWTERSPLRSLQVLRVPFAQARAAAADLGGTINTLLVTAAADGAGRYHRSMGAPVESLRTSMAVSTRHETSGANAFALTRLTVPTGVMRPAQRFAAVNAEATRARTLVSGSGAPSLDTLASLAALVPTPLLVRLARQQTGSVDFATSNVKAAPFTCYMAGAQIMSNHPVGPLMGTAFNMTLLSYNGSLDIGINIDARAVSDPALLRTCVKRSFTSLLRAGTAH
jgi:WS/DGAT/MGAT family acyltransferase